jgi:aminoglycoside phosphotransferase (APT) family kinase protein
VIVTPPNAFDPDDTQGISESLAVALAGLVPGVTSISGLGRVGRGLDTYVYGFHIRGDVSEEWRRPLILRVYSAADHGPKARREHDAQLFVTESGFPAPRPLFLDESAGSLGRPFMVMERMPGVPMLEKMRNPFALGRAVRRMAALHVRLHRLAIENCPLPASPPLVDRKLAQLHTDVDRYGLSELAGPLEWLDENKARVAGEEIAFTHNDFHPLNILIDDEGRLSLLDWADAALGDRHCDVARTMALFAVAPYLVNGVESILLRALKPYILRTYKNAYARRLPLDDARISYWQALHAAHGMATVLIATGPRAAEAGARLDVSLPSGLVPALRRLFESFAR